jgi:hypothetical protein
VASHVPVAGCVLLATISGSRQWWFGCVLVIDRRKLRQVMLSVPGCPSSDFTYAPDQAHEDSGSCNIAVSSAVQRVQTRYQLLR